MDSELYTPIDAVVFYLFYYRYLFFSIILLIDIYLFSHWNTSRRVRLPALLLIVPLAVFVVRELSIRFF